MKNIFKYLTILVITLGLSSCSDYLDINDPVNDPSASTVTPDLILAGAMTRTYSAQGVTMNRLGNVFMNNWSANVNSFTGGFNEEYQLILSSNFYSAIWDNTYLRVKNFDLIIDSEFLNYENHKAIAKIMKSFYMQYIVDLYGDCPYSQAFDLETSTPAYDNDQAIYRSLITEIDGAIDLINNNTVTTLPVGEEDVIFDGDMSMWVKMANTLKLRILMRQATLAETDGETATYLNEQFANLDQDFLTTSAVVQPGYNNNEGLQNPFYSTHGFDTAGNMTTTNRFIRASQYAQEFLDGTLTGVTDQRITSIYAPIPGATTPTGVVGVDQDIDSGDPNIPAEISGLGTGLIIDSSQDGYIMLAAESYFLQAEAAFRGYISGDAKALFQSGIMASFAHYGLDGTAYITQSNTVPELGWDGSSNKIEAIMTQKWIATNGINGIESWVEYVRTGYPDVPLAQSAQRPTKPNRLMYPASELVGNAANVPNQTQNDAFTTKIFWDNN
ncbi:SusD/RagB family nutrient-binding outer membrane lipoprotein [Hanstruepera neustonica]|uniref:SusD/RagB family nutrient-binding outer membrane lipoprotein n=1 Tax=Hanstruepera neustonica TaxID=1445657 RepID=A0A2K1E509_9FLAO|nr:SusD/RagB family nutrient-binding outer membrane lipoprotein [Hanstruepera neustonica]PNQ75374.1 SusD/RagB family nutrient-binding outer membrane lipoprotein [Hanstruepera neustonica]